MESGRSGVDGKVAEGGGEAGGSEAGQVELGRESFIAEKSLPFRESVRAANGEVVDDDD